MKKSELKNIINEAIDEAINETMQESAPPGFPPALEKKILAQYKDQPPKAYATMWTIHNMKKKKNKRVSEMWMAWEKKDAGKNVNESAEEDPLYVEYVGEMQNEEPFMAGGKKFQFVRAKYPNGKTDIGVYAFQGDVVYSYNAFKQMYNLKEVHDETDMNNPEEKKEVEITKKIKKHVDALLKMHGQLDEASEEADMSDPAEKKEVEHAAEIKKLADELLKMHK